MKIDTVYNDSPSEPKVATPEPFIKHEFAFSRSLPSSSGNESTASNASISSLGASISDVESGGNYKATNPNSSAVGKYQFLWGTHNKWIKKVTGVADKDSFLNSPEAQEKAYQHWESNTLIPEVGKIRKQYGEQSQKYSDKQLAKMVHFRGEQGARDYLTGKLADKTESYNMSVSKYIGKHAYGGPIKPRSRAWVDSTLNANRTLNFVKRYQNPNQYPVLDNGNGDYSSHRMASSDGIVYPTIIQDGDKLKQLDDESAYQHARKTKEFIKMNNDNDAQWMAHSTDTSSGYKMGTQSRKYGVAKHDVGGWLSDNKDAVSGIAGTLGTAIQDGNGGVGDIAGGALSGAASGMALGPVGAVVGGAIGLATGIANAQKKKEQARINRERKAQELNTQFAMQSQQNLAGGQTPLQGYYAAGGVMQPEYEVEKDEVVQGDAMLEDGKQIASDMHLVGGKKHEEGGTLGAGGDRAFSARLPVTEEVRNALKRNGINVKKNATVADAALKIGTAKGKLEKKVNAYNSRGKVTASLMGERYAGLLEEVFGGQEQLKEQSMFAYGGVMQYGGGGELPGTEAVRNYQIYLNKKHGTNLDVTGKWDKNTQDAYEKTGKIDYKKNKKEILSTAAPGNAGKEVVGKQLPKDTEPRWNKNWSTNEADHINDVIKQLPIGENARKVVRGKSLKDTFAKVRAGIVQGEGEKDVTNIGINNLPKIEKIFADSEIQLEDNVRFSKSKIASKRSGPERGIQTLFAFGGHLPQLALAGNIPPKPKPKSKVTYIGKPLATVNVTAKRLPATPAPIPTIDRNLLPKLSTPGITKVANTTVNPVGERAEEVTYDAGEMGFLPYAQVAAGDIAARMNNANIQTRPETNLVSGPSYKYQDRSQGAKREIAEMAATTVLPDRLKGQAFVDKLRAVGDVNSQENQRRDAYDEQYNNNSFRTNAINSNIVNQANQIELQNSNIKNDAYGAIAQGTLANMNTIEAEKNKRQLDAKKIAYLAEAAKFGRTSELGKETIEKINTDFRNPNSGKKKSG